MSSTLKRLFSLHFICCSWCGKILTSPSGTASIKIKNIVSSSYGDYSAPFKRQVFISKIGIYDENKNLIGVATLSNPILKEDGQDISFKMKIDV